MIIQAFADEFIKIALVEKDASKASLLVKAKRGVKRGAELMTGSRAKRLATKGDIATDYGQGALRAAGMIPPSTARMKAHDLAYRKIRQGEKFYAGASKEDAAVRKARKAVGKGVAGLTAGIAAVAGGKKLLGKKKEEGKTSTASVEKTALVPELIGLSSGYSPGRNVAGETAAALAPHGRVTRSENIARQAAVVGAPAGGIGGLMLANRYGLPAIARGAARKAGLGHLGELAATYGTPVAAAMGGSLAGGALTGGLVGGVQKLRGSPYKKKSEKKSEEEKKAGAKEKALKAMSRGKELLTGSKAKELHGAAKSKLKGMVDAVIKDAPGVKNPRGDAANAHAVHGLLGRKPPSGSGFERSYEAGRSARKAVGEAAKERAKSVGTQAAAATATVGGTYAAGKKIHGKLKKKTEGEEKVSSDVLAQRAADFWKAKSQAAEAAGTLPTWQRAEAAWKARQAGSSAAKKGVKKGVGFLASLLR